MSDRIHVLTVALERPMKDEDVEPLVKAIRELRGVSNVTTKVCDPTAYMAIETARHELLMKLIAIVRGEPSG